jgi:uncharacterized protein YndB with AHSA1/START domain
MSQFSIDIIINAPRDVVWSVLSDIGAIAQWNPGIKESYATSEQPDGPGATRFCDLGGKNYLNEEVVQWKYCEKLTMRVVASNMPFESADIHFTLEDEAGMTEVEATKVTVAPEYQLKYGLAGQLMDRFYVRNTYEKGMQNLLRGLKEYVEQPKVNEDDLSQADIQTVPTGERVPIAG